MQTPAGKECKYFYGDYFRGRNHEECRLLEDNDLSWSAYMCQDCPIPDILLANSCEHQQFIPELKRPLLIKRPIVKVTAFCTKTEQTVNEPRIGCGQCHDHNR